MFDPIRIFIVVFMLGVLFAVNDADAANNTVTRRRTIKVYNAQRVQARPAVKVNPEPMYEQYEDLNDTSSVSNSTTGSMNYPARRLVERRRVAKVRLSPISAGLGTQIDASMRIPNTPFEAGLVGEINKYTFGREKPDVYGFGALGAYHFSGSPYRTGFFLLSRAMYRFGTVEVPQTTTMWMYNMNAKGDVSMIHVEGVGGYQWQLGDLVISAGIGASGYSAEVKRTSGQWNGLNLANVSFEGSAQTLRVTGLGLGADLAIGWTF